MNVGDKVSHPKLGVGTVTKIVAIHGRSGILRVNFGYTDEFISADEVDLEIGIGQMANS